jgi:hypothetical protein
MRLVPGAFQTSGDRFAVSDTVDKLGEHDLMVGITSLLSLQTALSRKHLEPSLMVLQGEAQIINCISV